MSKFKIALIFFVFLITGYFIVLLTQGLPLTSRINPVAIATLGSQIENSRTMYGGYVEIEPTTKSLITEDLNNHGCTPAENPKHKLGDCFYTSDTDVAVTTQSENKPSIRVYPRGAGMGPTSFVITENKILFGKDIQGLPNIEKAKTEVREDTTSVLSSVKLIESKWFFTNLEYPVNWIY